jgi:hypothetical protein
MDPQVLTEIWGLSSVGEAQAILGGNPATLGATVPPQPQTARPNTTLEQVAANTASLKRLTQARNRIINNATIALHTRKGGNK